MKILIDVRLLGRGGASGVHEYTRNLVDQLLTLDDRNDYLLFYNGLRKNPLPLSWTVKPNVKILNWKIPNRLLDASVRFLGLPQIDRLVKTDLIFSPHFNILANAAAPRLITFHDLSFIHHPYFFNFKQRLWHHLQNWQEQVRKATHLIADSEFTKSDLMELAGINEEKITVIYPGVSSIFRPLAKTNRELKAFKEKHQLNYPFILYLGTIEPRKNIKALIRAFEWLKTNKEFKDLWLILAGRPGWLYEDIIKAAQTSKFQEQIILWGPVEERDKIFLYNLARIFVYPSFFEGFGFPPLEAQACGTPVIAANRTSLPEVIGKSGILVDPWRIDELTQTLKEVLNNNQLRERLIAAGFKNVQKFNWGVTARKTLNLFSQL